MKFTIDKNLFRTVLSRVQGITNRQTNLAITEAVLIETTENGIHLSATDTETGMDGFYPAEVESQGKVAINSRKLFEIVRDFPGQDIVIHEVENRWIEIGKDKIEYHIVGMNPDDFPINPEFDDISLFEIDSAAFKLMIEQTAYISGVKEESRPFILCVYMETATEPDGQVLTRLVSTDTSRLAKSDYFHGNGVQIPLESPILIPKKGMVEVIKFLEDEGTVSIGAQDTHFIIKKENEIFSITLMSGSFPNYRKIMERDDGYSIKMNRKEFLWMLKRMSILCNETYKAAIFSFRDNKLYISATNPEIGESKEEMEIEYEGDHIETAFNPKFFIDTLSLIEDEMVDINILSSGKPCIVRGDVNNTFITAIMPMKI